VASSRLVEELRRLPTYPEELGLDLSKPEDRFKWLLASMLFAKRISADIALRAYRSLEARGYTSPEALLEAGWRAIVDALDEAGYVRYDFSTATYLLEAAKALREAGGLEAIYEAAEGPSDLEARLMELKGVGPTAVNIFLRELRDVWSKARPKPSRLAVEAAERLGIPPSQVEGLEPRLVRLALEYCKRRRCQLCPVGWACTSARGAKV
jgi:endonuclease III